MTRCVPDYVAKTYAQIISNTSVDAYLLVRNGLIGQNNADRLLPSLALHQHCVASKQLQFVHFGLKPTHSKLTYLTLFICNTIS